MSKSYKHNETTEVANNNLHDTTFSQTTETEEFVTPNQLDEQLEVAGRGGRGVVVEEEQRGRRRGGRSHFRGTRKHAKLETNSPYWLLTID